MKKKSKILLVYFLTLCGIIIWLGVIFLAPYLKSQSSGLQAFCYGIFSPICHQNPSRSFFLFGYPLGVCARCFGIYFGFLGGTGLYPFSFCSSYSILIYVLFSRNIFRCKIFCSILPRKIIC